MDSKNLQDLLAVMFDQKSIDEIADLFLFNGSCSHYTDLNGCFSILKNKKLWLNHVNFLNDPAEGVGLLKFILSRLESNYKIDEEIRSDRSYEKHSAVSILDRLVGKTRDSHVDDSACANIFYYYLRNHLLSGYRSEYRPRDVYICSFQIGQGDDSIPIWHMYGNDGRGVCININTDPVKESNCSWCGLDVIAGKKIYNIIYANKKDIHDMAHNCTQKVIGTIQDYSKNHQFSNGKELLEKFFGIKNEITNLIDKLIFFASLIKDSSYESEREVRLLVMLKGIDNVKYRMKGNDNIVPYLEYKIVKDSIERIVSGPASDDRIIWSLKRVASAEGFDLSLQKSSLEYRPK